MNWKLNLMKKMTTRMILFSLIAAIGCGMLYFAYTVVKSECGRIEWKIYLSQN